mgnify:FL=1|tara:strand:+ start:683 stop:1309 length:627 start_codon:yes stop_codon:yes gene_type:complete
MATVEEEYEKIRTSFKRPLPGQSLTNDPDTPAPYEQAPKYTSVHAASEYLWESFIEPKTYVGLMQAVDDGVPIMNIVQLVLFTEFQEGAWNPDLMLMLAEPAAYMIMALAERIGLEMTIYTGDLDDENDDEDFAGTKIEESRIEKLIKDSKSGRVPEGVLTAQMQQSLESLPTVDLDKPQAKPSLMEAPAVEEEEEQSSSLMARPIGV